MICGTSFPARSWYRTGSPRLPIPPFSASFPRLIRALDRAIILCTNTMKYGRSEEAPPKRARVPLRALLSEVNESLGVEELSGVRGDRVRASHDQSPWQTATRFSACSPI